ncbi:glycosyltransferase family 4 protein [candidate division KSB1 bacterium]|nr:glycosyltransferase family 4 protein [candidate division KSB1 bacterium]
MESRLKILEIVFSSSWGGLEMNACNFAKRFKEMQHEIVVIAPPGSPVAGFCAEYDVSFIPVKPLIKYMDIITAFKLGRMIRRLKIDILHLHISKDLSSVVLAKKLAGRGKIIFSQHMDSRYNKKDLFHRWAFRNIAMIATVTKAVRKNVLEFTSVSHNQVMCIYNGVDMEKYNGKNENSSFKSELNIPEKSLVVGLVGRLDRLKKQELLIEAAPAVLEKYPDTYFVMVGAETNSKTGVGYRDYLEQLINRKNLSKKFRLVEFTEKITDLVSIFDISLLSTTKETFGMVLIEAMAMGIPVIGTDAGGVPEIIDDGVNGLLFEPDNPGELSNCLKKLLADEKLRISMGNEGIKKVKAVFDINKKLIEYERLFYSMLAPVIR